MISSSHIAGREFICNNAVFRDADREKMLCNLVPIDVCDKLQVME